MGLAKVRGIKALSGDSPAAKEKEAAAGGGGSGRQEEAAAKGAPLMTPRGSLVPQTHALAALLVTIKQRCARIHTHARMLTHAPSHPSTLPL